MEGGKFGSLLCHNLEVPVDIFSEPTLGFIDFYYCFSVTEIDDLDAIVPAVRKLKILSY